MGNNQDCDMSSRLKESNSDFADEMDEDPKITALNFNLPHAVELSADIYECGTDPSCDFMFLEKVHNINQRSMSKISPHHFTLHKCLERVIIEDHSCYGTFVNGVRISSAPGSKRHQLLQPKDKIAVGSVNGPCFQFEQQIQELNLGNNCLPKKITNEFHVLYFLKKGGSGQVFVALDKKTLAPRALKMIKRRVNASSGMNSAAYIFRELDILQSIKHETIMGLRKVIFPPTNSLDRVFLVMDFMVEGSMGDRLRAMRRSGSYLSEEICKQVAHQLLLALAFLHFHCVVHRDLKPDNVLIASWSADIVRIKLADFGLAKMITKRDLAESLVGTQGFMAPEVLEKPYKPYTSKVDIWSFGATLTYCILNQRYGDDEMSVARWNQVSHDARDMVCSSTIVDPKERPSAEDLLDHPWLNGPDLEAKKSLVLAGSSIMQTCDFEPCSSSSPKETTSVVAAGAYNAPIPSPLTSSKTEDSLTEQMSVSSSSSSL